MTNRTLLVLVSALLLVPACAGPPGNEVGSSAEVSHDGLVRVEKSLRFQQVWVRPGTSLAGYRKILPVDAGVHYKRPPRASRQQFPVSERQMKLLSEGLQSAITEALEKDGDWQIVNERGPDVLIVRAALIDVYLSSPPRPSAREQIYTSSAGEATLVVEIFDSESLEILARIADRRSASRNLTTTWRSDAVTNRTAAAQLFQRWAQRLREGMDYARTLEPAKGAESGD
jgi:hypothetical protein